MLNEASTLASISMVVAATLERLYRVDPAPVFAAAGLEYTGKAEPGARIRIDAMDRLWVASVEVTGDPLLPVRAGLAVKPHHYYAFGHSWLASDSILDGTRRLGRYGRIISTDSTDLAITESDREYHVEERYPDPSRQPSAASTDFGVGAYLALCDLVAQRTLRPRLLHLTAREPAITAPMSALLEVQVVIDQPATAAWFAKADFDAPLASAIPEVATATDRVVERYLQTLDGGQVRNDVRRLLIDLLPAGAAHQDRIAAKLHRSTSTLQRQLQGEGTTYREVLEDTRRNLATEYLRDGRMSHAEIAYLLGFSDQSNFSRAFKRWFGKGPRAFQAEN